MTLFHRWFPQCMSRGCIRLWFLPGNAQLRPAVPHVSFEVSAYIRVCCAHQGAGRMENSRNAEMEKEWRREKGERRNEKGEGGNEKGDRRKEQQKGYGEATLEKGKRGKVSGNKENGEQENNEMINYSGTAMLERENEKRDNMINEKGKTIVEKGEGKQGEKKKKNECLS